MKTEVKLISFVSNITRSAINYIKLWDCGGGLLVRKVVSEPEGPGLN